MMLEGMGFSRDHAKYALKETVGGVKAQVETIDCGFWVITFS